MCTVSLPFTSTSVAANILNKNSVYYDPIKKINKDDPSRCGIEVINDKNRLREWVNIQINNKSVNEIILFTYRQDINQRDFPENLKKLIPKQSLNIYLIK